VHKGVFLLAGALLSGIGCGQAEDPESPRSVSAGKNEAKRSESDASRGASADDDSGNAADDRSGDDDTTNDDDEGTRTEPDLGSSPAVSADLDEPREPVDPAPTEGVDPIDPEPSTSADPVDATPDSVPEPSPNDDVEPTVCPPVRSDDGPSFATTVGPLFNGKCTVSCHEPGGVLGGPGGFDPNVQMSLALDDAFQTLTQRSAQVPTMCLVGETLEDSYLWHKLNDTQLAVFGSGARMPITGELTAEELEVVRSWIEGGASP
jgi:hypothetical protein